MTRLGLRSGLPALLVVAVSASLAALSCCAFVPQSATAMKGRPTMRLMDTPDPLASEGNWQAYLDEDTTGLIYYFDTTTGESRWEPPTETFPAIKLPRRKQRVADELRREYRKARQLQENGESGEVGEMPTETASQETTTTTSTSWIEGLFDDQSANTSSNSGPAKTEQEEQKSLPQKQGQGQGQGQGFLGEMFGVNKPFGKKGSGPAVAVEGEEVVNGKETAPSSPAKGEMKFFINSIFSAPPASTQEQNTRQPNSDEKLFVIPETPPPIKIEMASYVLPHPEKMTWGGEDAVFTKGRTFGVFDGVSGADKLDGIPLYSKTLASELEKMVGNNGLSIAEMSLFLTEAAEFADNCATGASTAVIASIGENGFLQALNVGDSCCIIIRNGRITARTREISHFFDCPYQLSEDSPDRPKDGTKLNVELIAGDMIVMGSDGIFDNLSDDEILDTVNSSPKRSSTIAKKIVDLSRKVSLNPEAPTPYAKEAKKRRDPDYKTGLGGKLDDASCIVVICK